MILRRAFTIVEMLVVVAIIALLIGVVLPMLGKSRPVARQAVCASNLAQLSHAFAMHAIDHQQRYVEYREAVTTGATGQRWWFGFEPTSSVTINRPLSHDQGPLGPYLAGIGERLQCGEFPYSDPNHVPKFARPAASYGYNWKLSGMKKIGAGELPDETIRPQTQRRYRGRLSDVFLLADSLFFEPSGNPLAFWEGYYVAWQSNVTSLSGYAHFRHSRKANVLFLDGHVSALAHEGAFHKVVKDGPAANLASPDGSSLIYGD